MIKALKPESIHSLMNIIKEVIICMEMQGIYQWDEFYPNEKDVQQDIEKNNAYGYFEEGEIKGYIALNEEYSVEYMAVDWDIQGKPLIIHRLFVKPKQQGKGIAEKMMDFAEKYAKINHYSSIRLDAFSKNRSALRLYERIGYKKVGYVQFRKGLFFCYEKEVL